MPEDTHRSTEPLSQGSPKPGALLAGAQRLLKFSREQHLPKQIEKLMAEAIKHEKEGDYKSQLSSLKQADAHYDKLIESGVANPPIEKTHILVYMANACGHLSRYKEQIKYLESALEKLRLEPVYITFDPINIVSVLRKLGNAYGKIRKYEKQLELQKEALALYPLIDEEETIELADLKSNLGSVYGKLGNINEQIQLQTSAIEIYKALLRGMSSDNRLKLASVSNSLGSAYAKIGEYDLAEKYHTDALAITKSIVGNNHVYVATTLNSLGNTYKLMKKYDKQIESQLEALSMLKKVAPTHYIIGMLYNQLGIAYGNMDDNDNQKKYFDLAWRFCTIRLQEEDPQLVQIEYTLDIVQNNIVEFKIITLFHEWLSNIDLPPYLLQTTEKIAQVASEVRGLIQSILDTMFEIRTKEEPERISLWILESLLDFQETAQHGILPLMPPSMYPNPVPDDSGGVGGGPPCCSSTDGPALLGSGTNATNSNFTAYPDHVL